MRRKLFPMAYWMIDMLRDPENQSLNMGEGWYLSGTSMIPFTAAGDVLVWPFRLVWFGITSVVHPSLKEFWSAKAQKSANVTTDVSFMAIQAALHNKSKR